MSRKRNRRATKLAAFVDRRLGFFFVSPTMIILMAVTMFPLVLSYYFSLTDFYMITASPEIRFVGLDNYLRILQDPAFQQSAATTLIFVAAAIVLEFVFGLVLALILHTYGFPGSSIVRTLLLLPMMITPIVTGLTFLLLYNPDYGLLDYFLVDVFQLSSSRILWLSSPATALFSVILVDVWQWVPFITLLLLAGLSAQPREPFEAAEVDGASSVQKFRFLTLPLLRYTLVVTLLIRTIDGMKVFDTIFILTGGGPGFSTTVLTYKIFLEGLKYFRIGYASALSIVMALIASVITMVYIRLLSREK